MFEQVWKYLQKKVSSCSYRLDILKVVQCFESVFSSLNYAGNAR